MSLLCLQWLWISRLSHIQVKFSLFESWYVPPRCVLQVLQVPADFTGRHIRLTRVSKVLEIWVCEWMLCPPCDGFAGYILPLACEDRPERHLSVNHHKWWLTDKCRLMTSFLQYKHCLCHLHQFLFAGQAHAETCCLNITAPLQTP